MVTMHKDESARRQPVCSVNEPDAENESISWRPTRGSVNKSRARGITRRGGAGYSTIDLGL